MGGVYSQAAEMATQDKEGGEEGMHSLLPFLQALDISSETTWTELDTKSGERKLFFSALNDELDIVSDETTEVDAQSVEEKLLFSTLKELDITIETAPYKEKPQRNGSKGIFCKNLFLKDRKGQYYLVIFPEDLTIDLKGLRKQLGASRNFSFGTPEDLQQMLRVSPGSVTPFGLLFEEARSVRVVIDTSLAIATNLLNFHPFNPSSATLISYSDLEKFVCHCNHNIEVCDFNKL